MANDIFDVINIVTAAPEAPEKPMVLLLSLDKQSFFDEHYSNLIDRLRLRAVLTEVTTPEASLEFLKSNNPQAIFVTDQAVTEEKHSAVNEAVKTYVLNGGTAVLAGHFGSFMRPDVTTRWFSATWGLPWKCRDYHRTTVYLNWEAHGVPLNVLEHFYSQKATFLENVSPKAAWYVPSGEDLDESTLNQFTGNSYLSPRSRQGLQTPVAYAAVGRGYLGFLGDVNNEEGSILVILAMCRLV
jgi:hypothetical protein